MALQYSANFGKYGGSPQRSAVSKPRSVIPSFGAGDVHDSFVGNRECNVASINDGTHADPWGDYCDCMFLDYAEFTAYYVNGNILPTLPPFVAGGLSDNSTAAEKIAARDWVKATFPNQKIELRRVRQPIRTEDWDKCARNFCADITGLTCWNAKRGTHDPFNIGAGSTEPPWTDLGASSRGIPKRDAGFFYTLGQLFSLDASQYTPLNLWNTFWFNPGLYGLLYAKLLLVPGVGTAIQIAMTPIPFAPFPVPWQLLPLASVQCLAEGKDSGKYIFEPMMKGGVEFIKTGLNYLGTCGIGINVPCGIGIAIQKVCNDQIETGEINKVGDPFSRAVIRFLARYGQKLVADITSSVMGAKNPSVLGTIASLFESLARETTFDSGTRSFFKVAGKALRVAEAIFKGFAEGKSVLSIANDVVRIIFGVDLFQLKATAAVSIEAARKSITANPDAVPLDQAQTMFTAITGTIDTLANVLSTLSNALGGGLNDVVKDLKNASSAMVAVTAETQNTVASLNLYPIPKVPVPAATASALTAAQQAAASGRKVVKLPAKESSGLTLLAAGAAAYFLL